MTIRNSWIRSALAAMTLAAAGSAAQAAIYVDTYKPAGGYDTVSAPSNTASFSLNIKTPTSDGFGPSSGITENYGFTVGDTITSAVLNLWLADDGDSDSWSYYHAGQPEYALFSLEGTSVSFGADNEVDGAMCLSGDASSATCRQFSYDLFTLNGGSTLLSKLSDGLLTGTVSSSSGDFWFKGAQLTVTTAPRVPEPATLGLFGLGMMGVGMARRRRSQKA